MEQSSQKNRYIHIHPIWYTFIKYCESVKFGEIENLKSFVVTMRRIPLSEIARSEASEKEEGTGKS